MDILQSNECFYNETNAASTTFNATLIIHILFLVILLIWCIIWFCLCLYNLEDENHKNRGIYSTIAEDAPENGINYGRLTDYISMAWNFFQLFSFSFLDEFSIKSSEDSLFSISWLDNIIYYVKMILLKVNGLGDFILYFIFVIIILISFCIVAFYSINYDCHCYHCHAECCECWDDFEYYEDLCYKGYEEFFVGLLFYLSFGLIDLRKDSFGDYYCYLCYLYGFSCGLKDGCICCGCGIYYSSLENIPFIFKTILYDFLYIPIFSSLIKVFVCTYTCDYDSSIMNKEDAYPALDVYTSISCNSIYTIICFVLSFFAIAFYHVRASLYICYEYDKDYSGDISTNQRFQYIMMIGKFILTVLSTMFYFKPFILLTLNLIIFIILLITVVFIPARTAFTMEHSRLYISLFSVQVLTALMALLSQIFSSSSSLFSLFTVCLVPVGFIFGWTFLCAPSLNNSYPYTSVKKLMLNNDLYIRLLAAEVLIDELNPMNTILEEKVEEEYDEENEEKNNNKENEESFFNNIKYCFERINNLLAFGSIFHRGFSSLELIINAGNVLLESLRRDYEIISFEKFNKVDNINNDECLNKDKIKIKEGYKTEIINNILNLFDYEYRNEDGDLIKVSGNKSVSSNIFEETSCILLRDIYTTRKTEVIKIDEYKKNIIFQNF